MPRWFGGGGGRKDWAENAVSLYRTANQRMLEHEEMVEKALARVDIEDVWYRVTPVYDGDNLVPSFVEMEAIAIGSNGTEELFRVSIANVSGIGDTQ